MAPFRSLGMVSYLLSIVTMAMSRIISEIKRDVGGKSQFLYPLAFDAIWILPHRLLQNDVATRQ